MSRKNDSKYKFNLALSMIIFGTIGIFRRSIPWSSSVLACVRGIAGSLFLLTIFLVTGHKLDLKASKRSLLLIVVSGIIIGFNWLTLFEAYNYTSVACATLCYYMAPVFIVLATPLVFKKSVGLKGWLCVIASFIGIILISGVLGQSFDVHREGRGVALALFSALLYAVVILINKKIQDVDTITRTILQTGFAGLVLLPFNISSSAFSSLEISPKILLMVAIVCFIITGLTYALYFSSIPKLSSVSIALFSYLDPAVAVILSVVLLKEKIGLPGAFGAVLIIGSMAVNELIFNKKDFS